MAKIFYVLEKGGDYAQVNFFKTEKDALSYGQSQFDEFDMFDDTDAIYDEDNDLWFTGDKLDFKKGILFQMEDGDWSIDAMDEADAREEVDGKENFGAIYFDGFKPGAYGYLGNGGAGKGYKWSAGGKGYKWSANKTEYSMKHIKLFEEFINEANRGKHKGRDLYSESKLNEAVAVTDNLIMKMKPGSTIKVKGILLTKDKYGNWRSEKDPNDILVNRQIAKIAKGMKAHKSGNLHIIEGKLNEMDIMKHIKLFEQFINEASSQQRAANKEVKELQNILKTRQSELAKAEPEDEAYAEDRVDTIERLLAHALSYQVIANLAAKADAAWDDQEVIKQMIKRQEDWLKDRQEVAVLIKNVIKSKQFDDTRMFSTKQFGSEDFLKTKLAVTEENITNTKARIAKLEARLA